MNQRSIPATLCSSVLAPLLLLAGCHTAQVVPKSPGSDAAYRRSIGTMIAADGPAALAQLRALPTQSLTERQRQVVGCMLERFGEPAPDPLASPAPVLPPASAAVLAAYRRYWSVMLMRRADKAQAEEALRQALSRQTGLDSPELEAQAEAARVLVEREGLHALGGVTAPLHELMIWRKQTSRAETVLLPEESIEVSVSLLDDFVSYGWLGHATCDLTHTGGWATPEGLMVVSTSWDFTSEDFRISLLAHEAQHFADYRRYPKLAAADLEYRAKLVELTLAETTQHKLLEAFAAQAQPDRASPHAYASHWLLSRLGDRLATHDLQAVPGSQLRAAAQALLRQHTQSLVEGGAATVHTALP